jgi:hypothetical protein
MDRYLLASLAAILAVCSTTPAQAQSKLIQNMDVNKDGKVIRDEIPEGATRRMFDNIVEKYKLDPQKPYTIAEIEQAMGLAGSSASASSSGPASRSNGSRRSFGPSGRSGTTIRAPSDGRPFRALEEMPDPYRSHDKDGDGQVGLYEWPRDRIRDFVSLDANDDGFITIDEVKKTGSTSREKKDEVKSTSSGPSTP